MKKEKDRAKLGGGCLGLFGGVFVLGGLIPGWFAASLLLNAWQASSWKATPATLTEITLDRSKSGDSGYTYSLEGQFRYEFDGDYYTSNQLDFDTGKDNIGDYHQTNYDRLRPKTNQRDAVTAYVNPDDPSQAVLIPGVRWSMVAFLTAFMLVFGGVGALIIVLGVVGARKDKARELLQQVHPEQPWRWDPQWDSNEIPCSGKTAMAVTVSFAVLWNLLSSFVWFVIPGAIEEGNYKVLLAGIFPAIGLALGFYAASQYRRWKRYGRTVLVLEQRPVRVGGSLTGYLKVSPALAADQVSLTLSCLKITTSGSGKNRRTHQDVLFQDMGKSAALSAPGYRRVAVNFPLPADGKITDLSNSRSKIRWQLEAKARVAGPDLKATFEVPVFEADLLDPLKNLGQINQPEPVQVDSAMALSADLADTGVVMDYRGGGLRYYFPPARHLAMGSSFSIFGSLACSAAVFGWHSGEFPLLVNLGLGAFGAVFLFSGLHILLWRSELRTQIGQLSVRSGWRLGAERRYRASQIQEFVVRGNLQVGTTQYYQLAIKTDDGKKQVLAGGLNGKRNTDALVDQLCDAIGFRQT